MDPVTFMIPVMFRFPVPKEYPPQHRVYDEDDLEILKWEFFHDNVMEIIGKNKTPSEIGTIFKEWAASYDV